jgi:hypothetical protein
MPSFKVTLAAPVEITAYCDITVEAESEEDAADKAAQAYNDLEQIYKIHLKEHHNNLSLPYPQASYFWRVNDDDLEGNINEDDIEVDSVNPIEP